MISMITYPPPPPERSLNFQHSTIIQRQKSTEILITDKNSTVPINYYWLRCSQIKTGTEVAMKRFSRTRKLTYRLLILSYQLQEAGGFLEELLCQFVDPGELPPPLGHGLFLMCWHNTAVTILPGAAWGVLIGIWPLYDFHQRKEKKCF